MDENLQQTLQAIVMLQQQSQELNQRLAVSEQRAVTAEQRAAAAQAGVGPAVQAEPRVLVDARTLGKLSRKQETQRAKLCLDYKSLARQIDLALARQICLALSLQISRDALDESRWLKLYLPGERAHGFPGYSTHARDARKKD
eukprot:4714466-Amphidinium_carterae.1